MRPYKENVDPFHRWACCISLRGEQLPEATLCTCPGQPPHLPKPGHPTESQIQAAVKVPDWLIESLMPGALQPSRSEIKSCLCCYSL
jgi:hypothetical protein